MYLILLGFVGKNIETKMCVKPDRKTHSAPYKALNF